MPELPEVETTRRGIEPYITNQKIIDINIYNSSLRFKPNDDLNKQIGQDIKAVKRRAKYLLLEVNDGYIMLHLGMSGSLKVVEKGLELKKHDHIDICLSNNKVLRFNDARRFGGCLFISKDLKNEKYFKHLGPEPLEKEFDAKYLKNKISHKKSPIKEQLMKNEVVVGVGNIYANEVLYSVGINPLTHACNITKGLSEKEADDLWKLLVAEIKKTLKAAIKVGGTTLKDFVRPDGQPGYFVQQLKVYGRAGEKCFETGDIIQSVFIGGRNSFYSPKKQPFKQ